LFTKYQMVTVSKFVSCAAMVIVVCTLSHPCDHVHHEMVVVFEGNKNISNKFNLTETETGWVPLAVSHDFHPCISLLLIRYTRPLSHIYLYYR
jgi:hypothetical protein